MGEFPYQFDATIKSYDFNRYVYAAVYLPANVRDQLQLGGNPRLRVEGFIGGAAFRGACQPAGNKKWYLMLSKKFLKANKLSMGDRVTVELAVADQDAVDVPEELRLALAADDRAAKIWQGLTAGKQRGFAYRVSSAKRAETRERRVEEVLESLHDF